MTERRLSHLLRLAGAGALMAGVTAAVMAYVLPVDVGIPAEQTLPSGWIQPASASEPPTGLTEEQFKYVWAKQLQKAPPAPVAVAAKPKPKAKPKSAPRFRMNATLIGTLVDEGFSCAWIEAGGKRQMVMIGQAIDAHRGSPVVEKIEDQCVHVSAGGEVHRIEMPTPVFLVGVPSSDENKSNGLQGR